MHSMLRFSIFSAPLDHPKSTLIVLFFLWKTFLLLVVAYSPGPGWDTSTYLLHPDTDGTANQLLPGLSLITKKLTRWDGIWFTTIAQRSYLFEQDWAFGWGFTRILAFFANGIARLIIFCHHVTYKSHSSGITRCSSWLSGDGRWQCRGSLFPWPICYCTIPPCPRFVSWLIRPESRLCSIMSLYIVSSRNISISTLCREYFCSLEFHRCLSFHQEFPGHWDTFNQAGSLSLYFWHLFGSGYHSQKQWPCKRPLFYGRGTPDIVLDQAASLPEYHQTLSSCWGWRTMHCCWFNSPAILSV